MEDMANVLVVDDELGPRESLKMILKPMFNVYTAKDGQEALEFIKEKSVNLVTLDLKMPGMSGIAVLKEIKKCNPNTEVIVLTGYGSMNTAVEALRCGALDYLTKPFDINQVETLAKKGIEKYKSNILTHQLAQTLDISDIKMNEVTNKRTEQLEDQFLYAEKLTVLGQLAPKIAHEINNPLQIIYGRAQQGLMKSVQGDILNAYFENIFSEAEKIDHIAQQLMNYGRPSEHKKEMINVREVLEESLCLLRDFGEIKRCKIYTFYGDEFPLVNADRFQLQQVFINLIINSSHALEEVEEKKLMLKIESSPDKKSVEITISDTGCGIPEENLDKIFVPFFTTKEGEKGNGLGLSVIKAIVDKYQGHIEVKSKVGEGTSFTVHLPVHSQDEVLGLHC